MLITLAINTCALLAALYMVHSISRYAKQAFRRLWGAIVTGLCLLTTLYLFPLQWLANKLHQQVASIAAYDFAASFAPLLKLLAQVGEKHQRQLTVLLLLAPAYS